MDKLCRARYEKKEEKETTAAAAAFTSQRQKGKYEEGETRKKMNEMLQRRLCVPTPLVQFPFRVSTTFSLFDSILVWRVEKKLFTCISC